MGLLWLGGWFLLGLAAGWCLIRLTPALAIEFPNRDKTVGDLAREVLVANHARLSEEIGGWNKAEVWAVLQQVVVKQTGVDLARVTPEARIVDDLGID